LDIHRSEFKSYPAVQGPGHHSCCWRVYSYYCRPFHVSFPFNHWKWKLTWVIFKDSGLVWRILLRSIKLHISLHDCLCWCKIIKNSGTGFAWNFNLTLSQLMCVYQYIYIYIYIYIHQGYCRNDILFSGKILISQNLFDYLCSYIIWN
jgi:hypothetical protein